MASSIENGNACNLISNLRNYPHILNRIFFFVNRDDLRTIPCVCRDWHVILLTITLKANRRRLKWIEKIKHYKKLKGKVTKLACRYEMYSFQSKTFEIKRETSIYRKHL
ncbi:hypothetical protein SSS_09808 [Sarcoptes scabiei]|nr:hypothetical protein SSS_09808 [Sarcoptes scabiei]